MEPLRRLVDRVACPLPVANVDTDQIIPARFMATPRSAGYGRFLMHDQRFGPDGVSRGHWLDRPEFAGATVLVARRNFGCGSSREAAVYALFDFGIRCVIAPGFGEIFAANAVNNGLLPAQVSEQDCERLLDLLTGSRPPITVDLEATSVRGGSWDCGFRIDAGWRTRLINGWDDLDLTLSHAREIANFAAAHAENCPWSIPAQDV